MITNNFKVTNYFLIKNKKILYRNVLKAIYIIFMPIWAIKSYWARGSVTGKTDTDNKMTTFLTEPSDYTFITDYTSLFKI